MGKTYLENAWYFGGWSKDMAPASARQLQCAERELALYRSETGAVHAIGDRCPHRFAPLHLGKVKGEILECGYHGLQFGAGGDCVFNPHMKGARSGAVAVPSYATIERDGAIWVWLSQRAKPDPSLIPDFSFLSTLPDTAMAPVATMEVRADYELLIDNLLDPTHAEFLHAGVLGGDGLLLSVKPAMRTAGQMVEYSWSFDGRIAVPVLRTYMPDVADVDTWLTITWYAPTVVVVQAGIKPAGAPREEGRFHEIYHICTPGLHNRTVYDVMTTRNFDFDNAALTEKTVESLGYAFTHQDKPMIEAQQAMMGDADFWELKPALFPSDAPGVSVRRTLQQMIDESADALLVA
ncbi:MAG TPA: aromatic ring-hydroxylating dioxygenase subunit alpha [Sphingobium sp.]|nr:aromatic ring-hydroxylating dioxygenase subunit alpha [Sphingobium sp.]